MIYDCFPFFDELDVLEIRLNELDPVVDKFVLVEATVTHSGKPKPLHFQNNKERFAAFLDKIIHVVVEDMPQSKNPWLREHFQRDCVVRGLTNAAPDDIVMLSDADEIPRASVVATMTPPCVMVLDYYYYRLNIRRVTPTRGLATTLAVKRAELGRPHDARTNRGQFPKIPDAGWHFTYLGSAEKISEKLQAYAHQEFNLPQFTSVENIEAAIVSGTDLLHRSDKTYEVLELDSSWPAHILANRERFEHLIAP